MKTGGMQHVCLGGNWRPLFVAFSHPRIESQTRSVMGNGLEAGLVECVRICRNENGSSGSYKGSKREDGTAGTPQTWCDGPRPSFTCASFELGALGESFCQRDRPALLRSRVSASQSLFPDTVCAFRIGVVSCPTSRKRQVSSLVRLVSAGS